MDNTTLLNTIVDAIAEAVKAKVVADLTLIVDERVNAVAQSTATLCQSTGLLTRESLLDAMNDVADRFMQANDIVATRDLPDMDDYVRERDMPDMDDYIKKDELNDDVENSLRTLLADASITVNI